MVNKQHVAGSCFLFLSCVELQSHLVQLKCNNNSIAKAEASAEPRKKKSTINARQMDGCSALHFVRRQLISKLTRENVCCTLSKTCDHKLKWQTKRTNVLQFLSVETWLHIGSP